VSGAAVQSAFAQATTRPTQELPEEVVALLSSVEDFTFDFDQPGYYAVLRFVKSSPFAPGFGSSPVVVDDWRSLVERPGDFRGLPVTIEGQIGRNKDPYVHAQYPELGQVWQVELLRPDQPVACTVVFTSDVSDLPLGAAVRVTGYFVKVNRFPRSRGEPGLSALLVAPGPSRVTRTVARSAGGLDWRWLAGAIVGGLVVTFILLRRSRRFERSDLRALEPDRPAPLNLADDLAAWAARELPEEHSTDGQSGQ